MQRMNILLVDDKEGEGALLEKAWSNEAVRVWHIDELPKLTIADDPQARETEPRIPDRLDAVIIDLDLGQKAFGPAGGLLAIHALKEWQTDPANSPTIILRTQDVDDDRSLAAVLAAELIGEPLTLWGKSSQNAMEILSYLRDENSTPKMHGGSVVHPVRIVRDERGEQLLGKFLFQKRRAKVWERIHDGFDADIAVLTAGFPKRNKFWDQVNGLFSAIVFLRDRGEQLHTLNGAVLRLTDIEREIARDELDEVGMAIYEVQRGLQDSQPQVKDRVLQVLLSRQTELDDWISERRDKKPSFNRNYDQGEFMGVFSRVLGHPEIQELFD